ncbi:MAG: hypothetical protein M1828_003062 [Chrysothrix sp. TS-e1954]|nr:MAG: hypothetical protein M1828_003062 [Chrysothrix sp. TS-e1954]
MANEPQTASLEDDSQTSWSQSQSPSPLVSPSAGLSACPGLERSTSTASSITTLSTTSAANQSAEVFPAKRRGFTRPQATSFATSARNRDSVMSLGTIAHLQHYFARTGLLEGKGGQLAREDNKVDDPSPASPFSLQTNNNRVFSYPFIVQERKERRPSLPELSSAIGQHDESLVGSPDQFNADEHWHDGQHVGLPPTVSTYKHKQIYVPPPPDITVLRRELRESLEDARKLFKEIQVEAGSEETVKDSEDSPDRLQTSSGSQGWYEIQGLQVLDLVTLAIRAAKNYYTSHEQPQRLYAIRSERQIRKELYSVLELLKKLAGRNFEGGIRQREIDEILNWSDSIGHLVQQDEEAEHAEHARRENWTWLEENWEGREREREKLFLDSFDTNATRLPPWTSLSKEDNNATPFLKSFRDGLRLVHLHNELVKSSRRRYDLIKNFHTDTNKPYRCAENLRFWIKAAELRWDIVLQVDVSAVVRGESNTAWIGFDQALLQWCKAVREELTKEWREHRDALKRQRPVVRTDNASETASVPSKGDWP